MPPPLQGSKEHLNRQSIGSPADEATDEGYKKQLGIHVYFVQITTKSRCLANLVLSPLRGKLVIDDQPSHWFSGRRYLKGFNHNP